MGRGIQGVQQVGGVWVLRLGRGGRIGVSGGFRGGWSRGSAGLGGRSSEAAVPGLLAAQGVGGFSFALPLGGSAGTVRAVWRRRRGGRGGGSWVAVGSARGWWGRWEGRFGGNSPLLYLDVPAVVLGGPVAVSAEVLLPVGLTGAVIPPVIFHVQLMLRGEVVATGLGDGVVGVDVGVGGGGVFPVGEEGVREGRGKGFRKGGGVPRAPASPFAR